MFLIVEDIASDLKKKYSVNLESFDSSFVLKVLEDRMSSLSLSLPGEYLSIFRSNSEEPQKLMNLLGISVSSFFRNSYVYSKVEHQLLPTIINSKKKSGQQEIRIWSAGCATGEEPYSIAILLDQILKNDDSNWKLYIFATDIEPDRLEIAQKGIYARDKLINTKLGIVDYYFEKRKDNFLLKKRILNMIDFSLDDLTNRERLAPANSIFGSFDLILCRNVMIYFNFNSKMAAFEKLTNALRKNGYLILGESEGIDKKFKNEYIELDDINRIYKKA